MWFLEAKLRSSTREYVLLATKSFFQFARQLIPFYAYGHVSVQVISEARWVLLTYIHAHSGEFQSVSMVLPLGSKRIKRSRASTTT